MTDAKLKKHTKRIQTSQDENQVPHTSKTQTKTTLKDEIQELLTIRADARVNLLQTKHVISTADIIRHVPPPASFECSGHSPVVVNVSDWDIDSAVSLCFLILVQIIITEKEKSTLPHRFCESSSPFNQPTEELKPTAPNIVGWLVLRLQITEGNFRAIYNQVEKAGMMTGTWRSFNLFSVTQWKQ